MNYSEVTFSDQAVRLDGSSFNDCTFENVTFDYDGGPIQITGCRFVGRTDWRFGGALGQGLTALGMLYATRQAAGLRFVVDTMFPRHGA